MTLSATTIPQVTYTLRCDVTEALALRRSLKAEPAASARAVSFDALVVRAAALALADFPEVNSQWVEGQGIRVLTEVNIAVAVDLEDKRPRHPGDPRGRRAGYQGHRGGTGPAGDRRPRGQAGA